MDLLILTLLIIAGFVLYIIEVFLIPGFGLTGLAAIGCLLYANYFAFATLGPTAGIITLVITIIGGVGITVWFMKSKTLDKIALKKSIDYDINPLKGLNIKPGDQGKAVTRLALIGNAEIEGHIIEVRSSDGFIDEKTPVCVDRITDGIVYVRKI
ncbi:MAG: NfeD family protein [Phocaeicola sp.]|uniref:nodulation efficiency protein D (NfeD) n=1 Tax=Phocaeicola TaxID=909656 RepID=UPI00234EFE71|nr:nodulation efficiency protein D (NfeD) [Phocaeicola oris]MCE2615337.1 nodulation efficiency protein D (NfeD) [Phocaeicola oris]